MKEGRAYRGEVNSAVMAWPGLNGQLTKMNGGYGRLLSYSGLAEAGGDKWLFKPFQIYMYILGVCVYIIS